MDPHERTAPPSLPAVQWVNCAQPPSWDPHGSAPIVLHYWDSLCPNSLRDLRVLRAIHHRYSPWGLRMYGVHMSDFSFSDDRTYLIQAARRLGLRWPLALDEPETRWPGHPGTGPFSTLLLEPDGTQRAELPTNTGDYTQFELALRRAWRRLDPDVELPSPLERDDVTLEPFPHANPEPLRAVDVSLPVTGADTTHPTSPKNSPACELTGKWERRADAVVHLGQRGSIRLRQVSSPVYAILGTKSSSSSASISLEVQTDIQAPSHNFFGTDVYKTSRGAALRVREARLYHVLKASADPPKTLVLHAREEGLAFYACLFGPCVEPPSTSPS